MPSLRLQRVRELLKRQVGECIRRELPVQEVGLASVTDVQVSADLHQATVYVSVLGTPAQREAAMNLLRTHRKHIQGLVARSVILKYTPQLRFVVDDSLERGNRVLEIIEELEHDTPPPLPEE